MTYPGKPMNLQHSPRAVSESELHALLDNQLPAAERGALESRLAGDALATATLAAWRAQRDALRQLQRPLLDEPLPPSLLAAAERVAAAHQQSDQWWRWGGIAAGVLMAFGVGWLSHGRWAASRPDTAQMLAKARGTEQEFARQAALAHAVYVPEVRHAVEVAAAQQEHLLQWLSKRLDKSLKVPDLSPQGYEFVGGRLLPGDGGNGGSRAQFMFQNAGGERVTLYLGTLSSSTAATASRDTPLTYSAAGPVPEIYWVGHGFAYALAGKLPRDDLMKLAQVVYEQI